MYELRTSSLIYARFYLVHSKVTEFPRWQKYRGAFKITTPHQNLTLFWLFSNMLSSFRTATIRVRSSLARSLSSSPWKDYEMAPFDPIIGLTEEFQKDPFPGKVIVGVGAYRDDAGKPYVLPCVREAEKRLLDQNLDMEYSGIVSKL